MVTASIYIPIKSLQEFPPLHILPNTCYLLSFLKNKSHSDRCEVISHYSFDLLFFLPSQLRIYWHKGNHIKT